MTKWVPLDGKARGSSAIKTTNHKQLANNISREPLSTLSRKPPEVELRPASPPKINPWTKKMNPATPTILKETLVPLSPKISGNNAPKEESKGEKEDPHAIPQDLPMASIYALDSYSEGNRGRSTMTQSPMSRTSVNTSPRNPERSTPRSVFSSPEPSIKTLKAPDNGSHQKLLAAAARANKNLWSNPVGSDVQVRTETGAFLVHRDIITAESDLLRKILPPPNQDGSPVVLYSSLSLETVGQALRYLYTHEIDVCEDLVLPDAKYMTSCVLGYCAGIIFQIRGLIRYTLRRMLTNTHKMHQMLCTKDFGMQSWLCHDDFVRNMEAHLHDALETMYSQPNQRRMLQMRMVMARSFHTLLMWLMGQEHFRNAIPTKRWSEWLSRLAADATMSMNAFDSLSSTDSELPTESELDLILDDTAEVSDPAIIPSHLVNRPRPQVEVYDSMTPTIGVVAASVAPRRGPKSFPATRPRASSDSKLNSAALKDRHGIS